MLDKLAILQVDCPIRILHGVQVRWQRVYPPALRAGPLPHHRMCVCPSLLITSCPFCSSLYSSHLLRLSVALLPWYAMQDDAVPVEVAKRLFEELPAQDMVLTLVKDGDHRLARPQDIRMLLNALDELVECVTLSS